TNQILVAKNQPSNIKKNNAKIKNEINKALSIVNNYLNKSFNKNQNLAFLFLRSRLHLKLDNKEKAIKDLEEALAIRDFDIGWFTFAQINEKENNIKKAILGYSNYLYIVAMQPRNLAGQILFKAIESKLLNLLFSLAIKNHPKISPDKIKQYKTTIIQLFNKHEYKNAFEKLEKCITKEQCGNEKKLLKVQKLNSSKSFKKAANVTKQEFLKNPNNDVWLETLHDLYHKGLDSADMIAILQEIEKKHPNNLMTLLYLADMFTRTEQTTKAIKYHNKALSLADDIYTKTSLCYQLGILYYETKQFKAMEAILQTGKNFGLDYAPLINLLSYHYSSNKKTVAQAQILIDNVLEQYPNNPHFLDTQARIFYKQKKYTQALSILEKIILEEKNDLTIVKHLAKTYQKVGNTNQAIAYIKQAAKITYDIKKKKKYTALAHHWGHKKNETKSHMLCRR
ncbi:tetratricopeptide repeat protein, partial [bacterium]|nr:tetratricopeptide repeat protein [bacterium]